MKPIRFEAGRRLSKAEKDEVLRSLGDSYKDHNAPKVFKGIDRISGDPRYGYEYRPDLMYTSDITGRLIRHYVVLPGGQKAHPTELFPNLTKAEIDKAAMEREAAESLRQSRDRSRESRIADNKHDANNKYREKGRKFEGSYFAQDEAGRIVRVDGTDADDVSYYTAQGFKQITPVVNMAKRNASVRKLALPVEWQVRPMQWGGARWQHRQEEGDDVYDRTFPNVSDLEWYLADRYGWKFAKKVLAALKTSTGDPVGERKKNPTASQSGQWEKLWANYIKALDDLDKPASGPRARLKYARLAKAEKAIQKFDPEAYKRLIVGQKNPKELVYKAEIRDDAFRVYVKGHPHNSSGWIKYNSHSERITSTAEARREAAAFIRQVKAGVLPLRNPSRKRNFIMTALLLKKAMANPTKRIKVRNAYIDLVIKGQAKKTPQGWRLSGKTYEQGRGTVKVASGYFLDRATGFVYAKRERNMARRKTFRNPKGPLPVPQTIEDYRMFLDEFHRLKHLGASRTAAETALMKKIKTATTKYEKGRPRAKNIAGFIQDGIFHPIRSGMEMSSSGKLRKSKRKYRPSAVGEKRTYAKKRKPTKKTRAKSRVSSRKKPATVKSRKTAAKPRKAAARRGNPKVKVIVKTKNPRRGTRRRAGRTSSAATRRKELYAERLLDKYNFGLNDDHDAARKAREYLKGKRKSPNPRRRKTRRNPTASETRKMFAGRHTRNSTLYFPDGTPGGLAKLGKLVKIKTRRGTIKITRNPGEVWLCCDERGKFHLGSTVKAPLYSGAPGDLGQVEMIEYAESKPHLGYGKTIWFHKLGEEGGRKPTLHANSKGELRFKGGDYRITSRGIED